ncbi:MAG: hypothetical protein IPI46_12725 [Bacteroidetes bacterium]|nr:hypothetical protein [Bacteroidota bacterium]
MFTNNQKIYESKHLPSEEINSLLGNYYPTDLNGDGNVDLLDSPILENNVNNFIYSIHA